MAEEAEEGPHGAKDGVVQVQAAVGANPAQAAALGPPVEAATNPPRPGIQDRVADQAGDLVALANRHGAQDQARDHTATPHRLLDYLDQVGDLVATVTSRHGALDPVLDHIATPHHQLDYQGQGQGQIPTVILPTQDCQEAGLRGTNRAVPTHTAILHHRRDFLAPVLAHATRHQITITTNRGTRIIPTLATIRPTTSITTFRHTTPLLSTYTLRNIEILAAGMVTY